MPFDTGEAGGLPKEPGPIDDDPIPVAEVMMVVCFALVIGLVFIVGGL